MGQVVGEVELVKVGDEGDEGVEGLSFLAVVQVVVRLGSSINSKLIGMVLSLSSSTHIACLKCSTIFHRIYLWPVVMSS